MNPVTFSIKRWTYFFFSQAEGNDLQSGEHWDQLNLEAKNVT